MRNRPSDVRRRFHRSPLGLGLLLVVAVAVLVSPTPALAVTEGHTYLSSFGSQGTGPGQFEVNYGLGIGINQSNGLVYVADANNRRVEKFDENGTFLQAWGWGVRTGANASEVCNAPEPCHAGIFGGGPGEFQHPDAIAVDSSGGENDGDVYVVDSSSPLFGGEEHGLEYVLKFDENGHYLGKLNGSGSPAGEFGGLGWQGSVAVDEEGYVWVTRGNSVLKFSNEVDNEYIGGSEWPAENGAFVIAVNPAGSRVFVTGYGIEGGAVYRYTANGASNDRVVEGPRFSGSGWLAVDPVSGNIYTQFEAGISEYNPFGKKVGQDFGAAQLAYANGIAVNGTTSAVYVADAGNKRISVFVPRTVPDIVTGTATNVGHTTATLNGEVVADGGDTTECQFEIGPDTSYGTVVPCKETLPYPGAKSVTADVTGLTSETTYHYRLVAANALASNQGEDRTFTPHGVVGLTTEEATELTPSSTKLNASFDPNNELTHYHFEWGPDTSYGNVTLSQDAPAGTSGKTTVSAPLAGLGSYAQYHYRVVAENSLGTSYGDDMTLRTAPPEAPLVSDSAVSIVTDTTAHLSADVNPNLGETVYRFQYGTDQNYGVATETSEPIDSDQSSHSVVADLTELKPDTTYHFRVIATNFGGSTPGPDMSFTTGAAPVIGTVRSSGVSSSAATLSATVRPALSPTTVHFEYGTSTAYGAGTAETASIGSDNGLYDPTATLAGLAAGTTYHYRAVATNGYGTTTGSDQIFITAPAAEPPPPPLICKRGFVKRHGKCVKRPKHRKHKRHHHPKGRG